MRSLLVTVVMTAGLVVATGCGTAGGDATSASTEASPATSFPSSSAPAAAAAPSSDVVTVDVSIAGGQVEPPPGRVDVRQGQTVRITVTSDEADELHVHGYDIEFELAPGQPGTVDLVADQTGLFEVETHEQGLQLFQLVVA